MRQPQAKFVDFYLVHGVAKHEHTYIHKSIFVPFSSGHQCGLEDTCQTGNDRVLENILQVHMLVGVRGSGVLVGTTVSSPAPGCSSISTEWLMLDRPWIPRDMTVNHLGHMSVCIPVVIPVGISAKN